MRHSASYADYVMLRSNSIRLNQVLRTLHNLQVNHRAARSSPVVRQTVTSTNPVSPDHYNNHPDPRNEAHHLSIRHYCDDNHHAVVFSGNHRSGQKPTRSRLTGRRPKSGKPPLNDRG